MLHFVIALSPSPDRGRTPKLIIRTRYVPVRLCAEQTPECSAGGAVHYVTIITCNKRRVK